MQLPGLGTSAETLHGTFGVYHATRLAADKNTKPLVEPFEAAQARVKLRIEAHSATEKATMTAMAVRDGEDAAFDDAVRGFALAILAKVGNSRKAPLYLKYFPDGLNAIIGAPLESELQKAGVILSRLAEEQDESLKAHAAILSTALHNLSAAMDAHSACLAAEMQSYGMLQTEKVNWLDAYKRSYRDLTRMYFTDPKRADTYFKPAPKGKKNGNGNGAPAPAAAVK